MSLIKAYSACNDENEAALLLQDIPVSSNTICINILYWTTSFSDTTPCGTTVNRKKGGSGTEQKNSQVHDNQRWLCNIIKMHHFFEEKLSGGTDEVSLSGI